MFRSLYGMPWLSPSYRCFILRATRLSNKLFEQGYVKERLKSSLMKFYGRYGDLISQYENSLSQMLNDILWPDHIQWQPPTDQTLYRTRPFTEFWVVSIEQLRRVWHADRVRLLFRTPGPVPLGLAYVLLVETNPFPNLSLFYRTMLFEYPSVLSRFCFENRGSSHQVVLTHIVSLEANSEQVIRQNLFKDIHLYSLYNLQDICHIMFVVRWTEIGKYERWIKLSNQISGSMWKPNLWKNCTFSDLRRILYRAFEKVHISKIMHHTIKIQHASNCIPFSKYY